MAGYSEISRSVDFPLITDEIEYTDPSIPRKRHCQCLPNSLLEGRILESWSGDKQELFDNAAELYDSMRYEEEAELLGAPSEAQNFRFERVEHNPCVLHHDFYFGRGEATYTNGFKYSGDLQFSMMHGRGVLDSSTYSYSGTFRNNEIEGEGRYEWKDCVYEGEVKRGLRNGQGTLTFSSGTAYAGGWKEGLRHGYGKLTFPSGQTYEGHWFKGKKHGRGVLKYANGNCYEGDFEADKQHGQGTMHWHSSGEKYTGDWRNGKPHGFGVHIWLDGKGNKQLRNRYVGEWADGKRHGHGAFYYANGSKYEGEWANGFKEGEGTMTFDDGSVYKGTFRNDHMADRAISNTVLRAPSPKKDKKKAEDRQVEDNPFKNLVDISDLIDLEEDPSRAEKEVQNLLLGYYSKLKEWYSAHTTEDPNREDSFAMLAKQFWSFLRDSSVLSHKMTVAGINRLLLQGRKNQFSIQPAPADHVNLGQSYSNSISQGFADISNIAKKDNASDAEEDERLLELELDDVHSPTRPLLLRQFMEGLIRVAFLKFGNGGKLWLPKEKLNIEEEVFVDKPKSQLGIALYKLFETRLMPAAGDIQSSSYEEAVGSLNNAFVEGLFFKQAKKNRGFVNGKKDLTIEVRGIVSLLTQAGVVPVQISMPEVIEIIETTYDPETAYSRLKNSDLSDYIKTRTLIKVLGSEITEYEFKEILVRLSERLVEEGSLLEKVDAFINGTLTEGMKTKVNSIVEESEAKEASPPPSPEEKKNPKDAKEKVEPPTLPNFAVESFVQPMVSVPSKIDLLIQKREKEKQEELDKEEKENQMMEAEDQNILEEPPEESE